VPTDALLLTESDLLPLTRDPAVIDGAIAALEAATRALHEGGVTQATFMGRAMGNGRPSARLTLATGAGLHTGVRLQGNGQAANNRSYVLADGETGGVLSVMNFGTVNPLRVGASGGLAAKYLAPPRTHTLAVIGSSEQAGTQAQAIVRALPGLQGALVYSPNPQHRAAFAAQMTGWLGLPFRPVGSIDEAVGDAGVVTLANSAREVLLWPRQLQKGALVIDVSEQQLAPEFVTAAQAVFVTWEGVAANPIPREPYSTPIKAGSFTREHLGAELTAVVGAGANPRRTPDDTVVYVLTATHVHDLAMAQWAYDWARNAGVGTSFVLTP